MPADTGAYASAGPGLYIRANVSNEGPYQWPSAYLHGKVVYTNDTPAGAMRGFGAPQVAFAIEAQTDGMAKDLGIDPLEFRLINRRVTDASEASPMDIQQEDAYERRSRPYDRTTRRRCAPARAGLKGTVAIVGALDSRP